MSQASKKTLQRADILRPALYSQVIAENRKNVQRLMKIFGTQLGSTPPEHKNLGPSDARRVSFENCSGETTDLCARRNFAKVFPRANQDAGMPKTPEAERSAHATHVYDWASFMKAASLYPVFCGDIDASSYTGSHNADTLCKLELSGIFAHNVQETGANTATHNADGSTGCGSSCCCDNAGTHKARQALREYSELGCVQVVPLTALQWTNDLRVLRNDLGKAHGGVMKLQCKSSVVLKARDGASVAVSAGQEVRFRFADGTETTQFKTPGAAAYNDLDIANWVTAKLHTRFKRNYDASVRNCVTYTGPTCNSPDKNAYAKWFPCAAPPIWYFGRGAKQLTWNYNYGAFSLAFLGDAKILLNDPEIMITPAGKTTPQGSPGQPYLAFVSALWFYMTPQPPKPSMCDTIRGMFGDFAAPGSPIGFGDTTNIINGAQECGSGSESSASSNRMAAWRYWTSFFGISPGPEASQGCKSKPSAFSNAKYPMPTDGRTNVNLFWDAWWHPYVKYCKPVRYQTPFSISPSVNAAMTYSMCQEHAFKKSDPSCVHCKSPESDRCAASADNCALPALVPDTVVCPGGGKPPCRGDVSNGKTKPNATTALVITPSATKTAATTTTAAATKPSVTTASTSTSGTPNKNTTTGGDKRIVAYIPNWVACPSASQLQHYTHAMVAFVVTYPRYVPGGDNCGNARTCTVQTAPGCGGKTLKQMTSDLQGMGLKVILSFGGAGMGGSWSTSVDTCWDYCLGKVDSLVNQLDAVMVSSGADGLDVDYEYHTVAVKYQTFLNDLVVKLHAKMGSRVLLTHAPMDVDLCDKTLDSQCKPYYRDVLKAHADKVRCRRVSRG